MTYFVPTLKDFRCRRCHWAGDSLGLRPMTGGAEGGGCITVSFTGVPALSEPLTLVRDEVADEEEEDDEDGAGWK